jgi:SAM-dependent methyltransferase
MAPKKTPSDVRRHNRQAWDHLVEMGNPWTIPVGAQVIAAARRGEFSLLLTEQIPVPSSWFPPLPGAEVLCLASGGGQQGPVLAAAGARVTVFDNSPRQLERDRLVAEREDLELRTVEGDMCDLGVFPDGSFDLVFHPVSNVFVPDVRPVWREAYRVLRQGGLLMAGFMNPVVYLTELSPDGILEVKHPIPYSDLDSLGQEKLSARQEAGEPLEFGHSLADLLGGQCEAGFIITDLYEDRFKNDPIARYSPTFLATRAVKR